jgi:ribosome-associated protein
MESEELKQLVVDALDELKGKDIKCLDVQEMTDIADYMIIASGTSNRHVRSLVESVVAKCKENGVQPLGVEGEDAAGWVLIDLVDVLVHVMLPKVRDFYDLERLWSEFDIENFHPDKRP